MLHALNPATQKWAAPKAVTGVPTAWNTVTGNAATASTFDEKGRNIYLVAGERGREGRWEGGLRDREGGRKTEQERKRFLIHFREKKSH